MENLKPCPFCGVEPIVGKNGDVDIFHLIDCYLHTSTMGPEFYMGDEYCKQWQTRKKIESAVAPDTQTPSGWVERDSECFDGSDDITTR